MKHMYRPFHLYPISEIVGHRHENHGAIAMLRENPCSEVAGIGGLLFTVGRGGHWSLSSQ